MTRIVQTLIVLALGWGVLAFGAPYPWAFWPLAGACALAGALALTAGGRRKAEGGEGAGGGRTAEGGERASAGWRAGAGAILRAVAPVLAAILLQLVPLPVSALARLSPATDRLLRQEVVGYSLAAWHPLSIAPASTAVVAALLAAFGVFAAGAARHFDRRGVRWLGPALLGVGLLVALAGIVQAGVYLGKPVTHIYGFWKPEGTTPGGSFGPFVNRNHFAGWMLLALPVVTGFVIGRVSRGMEGRFADWHQRLVWFSTREANVLLLAAFGVVVMALSLVLTLSRSGITCLALALAATGVLVVRRPHEVGGARPAARRALIGYLVFVAVVSAGWAGVDAISARFAHAPGDVEGRVGVWRDTAAVVRDFPLAGTGIGTYAESMLVYQRFEMDTWTAEAHNDWLQLAAEGGVLVAVPALFGLAVLVREVRRRFREGDASRTTYWMRVGAVTGLLAIGLQEVVEFSLQMPGNAALFALLCAIAVHREGELQDSGVRIQESGGRPEASGSWLAAAPRA